MGRQLNMLQRLSIMNGEQTESKITEEQEDDYRRKSKTDYSGYSSGKGHESGMNFQEYRKEGLY